ncbi:tRNA-specific adenosine deaminase subunit TAD2 [Colletotrichum karsti]|uniref:tRNA-specific adenosine deaminase subunit TAD2 n=1 Tax=Colletotrichum karsti TaxID=1095194 RepID=A0A9P6LCS4_9PEZI|nr:tRNA-specific adenosine deaminase subunit TAD2 [Colletotrichum karsti]KAF9869534.1 tRNA-specific adenosine deaminase subunit TAD2 [Colletotrichum karsti]
MKKVPSTTESNLDDSPSQAKGKRLSTTGKFLQNIFTRLKSPFSPNTNAKSPSSTSTPLSAAPLSHPTHTQEETSNSEEPEMAAVATRPPSGPRSRDSAAMSASLNRVATPSSDCNKENRAPASASSVIVPVTPLSRLSIDDPTRPRSSTSINRDPYTATGEKRIHQVFMDQALDMARLALRTNETPVGCVLVYKGAVIARGMNATNVTRNGTRHAEFMALSSLLSYGPADGAADAGGKLQKQADERSRSDIQDDESELFPMDDDYVRNGHLYPYGQKLHRSPRVDRSIVHDCILYVTVEPCVMCAGLLRQLGIKKVYFGAVNDKFGGTGGVFSIHKNSTDAHHASISKPLQTSTDASNLARPSSSSSNKGSFAGSQLTSQGGDGGNVERGFEAEGGWGRDEAVSLLRRFYVQENGRAPVPRKKEGRAARLAAMEAGETGTDVTTGGAPQSSDIDGANDDSAGASTTNADSTNNAAIEVNVSEVSKA